MGYLDRMRLDGRHAVVTGGASGIGGACVDALTEAGARVTIIDLNAGHLAEAQRRLAGKDVALAQADVTDHAAIAALADSLGPVDILVNNAGIGRQGPAEDISEAEWNAVMDVNLNAVFWCAQAFGRGMLARGRGAIVNIGSMSAHVITRPQNNVHYNASKAAVHHLTRSLAAEWAGRGVRVNAVAPGFIETPMTAFALEQAPETGRMWRANTPSGRIGRMDEVGAIVLFLAADASSLMTGAVVVADGGYTLW